MQSADYGLGSDTTTVLDRSADRCILGQRQMRASLVVIDDIQGHDPPKV
jgi:hypothetical protein